MTHRLAEFHTRHGSIVCCDSLEYMTQGMADDSCDLILTSPPFALVRKKDYGNESEETYVNWFRSFGAQFHRILKPNGSLVIDIGGSWIPGQPTRSLYHFELVIMLCRDLGFHLAQEFYWWNPAKLPTPAEWVTVRRIRVKDAINTVYWLSKTPWPRASNKRVLAPYSESMKDLLKNGYKAKLRPSGHDISDKFQTDNGAAIPPNLIAIPNTESNSLYLRYCKEQGMKPHPARFPSQLPEYFVRMLTDEGDFVFDPFAGSAVTGQVCEKLKRKWLCCEIQADYVRAAVGRFADETPKSDERKEPDHYRIPSSSALWRDGLFNSHEKLRNDGGQSRASRSKQLDAEPTS
ncbi:MAG: DNA methylase [Planctomycetes bacterium RBG_13_60_9]|nr:MAG: DNA methylase [Planctomycetes bacterium RBG_13_60_9]